MKKPKLKVLPDVVIRHCPIDKMQMAARVALMGYTKYDKWPNNDCVMCNAVGDWRWLCTKSGNISVTLLKKK
jgi:hypothetical protein